MNSKPLSPRWQRFRKIALIIALLFLLISLWIYLYLMVLPNIGRESISFDDIQRYYRVHAPDDLDQIKPVPVVFVFHFRRGNAWWMEQVTQMNRVADEHGFIIVYPEGTPESAERSWADGSGRYAADAAGVDDVSFTLFLLESLTTEYNLDLGRVYAAGFSNGGMLTYRLACEAAETFAAAAVVVVSSAMPANLLEDCTSDIPMPMLIMHGTKDTDLPWEGLPGLLSVPDSVEFWVEHNQCSGEYVETFGHFSFTQQRYWDCEALIDFYSINDARHKWPGGGRFSQWFMLGKLPTSIDASEVIWDFFDNAVSQ